MVSPQTWLDVLAWTKALFEATKASIDLVATYRKYREDPATIREAFRVSAVYSTYEEGEIQALLKRLQGCRDRFMAQGGGEERTRCLCSVLAEAAAGNGGDLPPIDDWQNIYSQLKCRSKSFVA